MPVKWRAPAKLRNAAKDTTWSESDAEVADRAIDAALAEITAYFKQNRDAIQMLWDDSIARHPDSCIAHPQAWLADVLARIAGHPASQLDELLPWNWRPKRAAVNRAD
jgi:hypothetical protein